MEENRKGTKMYISEIRPYDKKRKKIVLEDGERQFLLYNGEISRLRLTEGGELTEAEYASILQEILKPRARKRAVMGLKDSDKTEQQIRRKLLQGLYPEEAVEDAIAFLRERRFLDDGRFAENYIASLKGKRSRREIYAKLLEKGVPAETAREALEEFLPEDETEACYKALLGKLGARGRSAFLEEASDGAGAEAEEGLPPEQYRKVYAFLMRKGFTREAVAAAFRRLREEAEEA